jgi:hypothetical protein
MPHWIKKPRKRSDQNKLLELLVPERGTPGSHRSTHSDLGKFQRQPEDNLCLARRKES